MLIGTARRALRIRIGMILSAATVVVGVGAVAPIHASAASTVRTLTFISKSFAEKDYIGGVFASRTLPAPPVNFGFTLFKGENAMTTDSQAQRGFQVDSFGSTWNNGIFSSPATVGEKP